MVQIITNSNGGGGGVGVYKYKGSVDYYEDLPTSGMKIGDTYNVVNPFTKDGKDYPSGTNVAWAGTDWDALGGSIDLSDYQKKLVEGAGIDIDGDTNEISVDSTVISGAAAGATAIQPNDDISELNNDAGYITSSDIPTNVSAFNNDAGYLVSSDLEQSDWNEADNTKIDYIKNKPTIGDATLTIQKNGTNVSTFKANAVADVTANITVPTNTSDLNNDSGFITSSAIPTDVSSFNNDAGYITSSDLPDLSGYQLKSNLVTDLTNPDNTHYPSALAVSNAISSAGGGDVTGPASSTDGHLAVFDGATGKIIKDGGAVPTPTTVVDALDSTSTTSALSANQGKVLKGMIDNLAGLGRFLSLWDSTTGLPISFPLETPYTYVTGDWFMVETVDTTAPITNYKPNGSSYSGTASTTTESGTVKQGDVYIYDGTNWLLQVNNEPQVSFSDIAGNATDNTSLSNALNAKANDSDVVKLTGNQTIAGTKAFSTSPVVPSKTSDATNTGTAIATEAQVYKKQDTISDLTTIRNGASAGATALQPSAISDTAYGSGWDADTTHAPSKNAVYDKIQSVVSSIPTVNNAILTVTQNGTSVGTFTANASSNVTIATTDTTYESKAAASGGTAVSLVTTGEKYTWNNKQNALTTQTAYTSKGTTTKVPQITTNTLGQVTTITEKNIAFPVTSVNNKTGAVTVSEFSPSGTATTGYVLTKTDSGYEWAEASSGGGGMCMDIFVVGGGGRGNYGGGGGGGVIEEYRVNLGGSSVCVKIGEGGFSGWNGGNSCIGCCIAYGGGSPGTDGGSGGGGGYGSTAGTIQGGLGVKGQGFNGGDGVRVSDQCFAGGGGGGAGGPGRTNIYYIINSQIGKYGGHGGPGIATYFFGDKRCFGGGGGGGGTGGIGCGGLGGGGDGNNSGTANTGGGGGGGRACGGGSGIAGIRYPADGSYGFSCATGGTVTTCTIGGVSYKIHTFTSDGTFTIVS